MELMWLGAAAAALLAASVCLCFLYDYIWRHVIRNRLELSGKHVMVTGGSSGIGLAVAVEAVKRGAHVSIVARSQSKLEAAKRHILQALPSGLDEGQKVVECAVDISTFDQAELERQLLGLVSALGPVFVLINCAGVSIPLAWDKLTMDQFRAQMDVNLFGSVQVTRAILPAMKSAGQGKVAFVSSLAGLTGLFGFTGYSASKFAVRGFAEALAMEVAPYGVSVTVSCPPDTETPGLATENLIKPEETKLISESAGLFTAETIARTLLNDTLDGKFLSSSGLDGFLCTNLCACMGPSQWFVVWPQLFVLGVFRLVAWLIRKRFDYIVRSCKSRRDLNKKSE